MLYQEKYKPTTFDEMVLPPRIKKVLEVQTPESVGWMMFSGTNGLGKSCAARILVNKLGLTYDTLSVENKNERTVEGAMEKIGNFLTVKPAIDGSKKVLIVDEADKLSSTLRDVIKGFYDSHNHMISFIFTTNNPYKFEAPIRKRFDEISFIPEKPEYRGLKQKCSTILLKILKDNGIESDDDHRALLKNYINSMFPDYRSMINLMGKIVKGYKHDGTLWYDDVLRGNPNRVATEIVELINDGKSYPEFVNYYASNPVNDTPKLITAITELSLEHPKLLPHAGSICVEASKYIYRAENSFSPLHLMAFVATILHGVNS